MVKFRAICGTHPSDKMWKTDGARFLYSSHLYYSKESIRAHPQIFIVYLKY
jgi:hypothetical protein